MLIDVIKGKVARKEISYRKLEYLTERQGKKIDNSFLNRIVNGRKTMPLDPEWVAVVCRALNERPEDFQEYRARVALEYFWSDRQVQERLYRDAKKSQDRQAQKSSNSG